MNFADFKKKLASDQEFAKKFKGAKTPAELVKLAAAEGYTFTEADIKNDAEVTPDQLEKAAGGGHFVKLDFSTSFMDWKG